MRDHLIYGLRVRSATELPALTGVDTAGEADLTLTMGPAPRELARGPWDEVYRSAELEGDRPVVVLERATDGVAWRLVYGEGVRFTFDATLAQLWADWEAPLTLADMMTFLTGPVLGFVLRRRGVLVLHASAVVLGGVAVGCVGPGGAGKSTLAAALAARGHPVVTDDVLALRPDGGRWVAAPGYGQLRIWEESEELLYGRRGRLRALSAVWGKRALPLAAEGYRFETSPRPLGGVVILDAPDPAASATRVTPARGQESLVALLGNTYTGYLLDEVARIDEMRGLAALLHTLRIGHLVPGGGGAAPARLAETVEAWWTQGGDAAGT